MIRAGGICVEAGKRVAERAVRKTRNVSNDQSIERLDVLMTTFKWVALGGLAVSPGILGLPPAWMVVASVVNYGAGKAFLLIDP